MSQPLDPDDWQPGIGWAELTDVGMRRSNNQDSAVSIPADSAEKFFRRGHLFVVADGMGAHAAGELASKIATEQISTGYFRFTRECNGDMASLASCLREAVEHANDEIHRRGQQNPEFHNMGTTASALAILPSGAIVAHVGDSRVYRLRGNVLEQLTFDHSLVWEMEASGQVHPGSALGQSIPKNVITRSLGPSEDVQVDIEGPFAVSPGDVFLLCSDGLSGQVEDDEIGAILSCLPESEAARVLIDLANLRGGPDNSTVIIARVGDLPSFDQALRDVHLTPAPTVSRLVPMAVVACAAGAAILGLAGMYSTMVIAILLGIAAAVLWVIQSRLLRDEARHKPRSRSGGGKGPYRRYNAQPTLQLNDRLKQTVDQLRNAAEQQHWELDWTMVDRQQQASLEAATQKQFTAAVRHQAKAIIETMKQLREQHNRAANETAIDQ